MPRPTLATGLAFVWIGVLVVGAVIAPSFGDPRRIDLGARLLAPCVSHWFGTDELGRDMAARFCYAARPTLLVALGATALALLSGFSLGAVGGWFGGHVDRVVVGLINLAWTIPFVVIAVLVMSVVGVNIVTLVLVIGVTSSVSSARVFRSEVLRLRNSEFITNARAYGFAPAEIFLIHLLPNLRAAAIGLAGYGAVETVTLESGLAFLGLSIPPPSPTWGGMMADGLQHISTAWWIAGVPAVGVTLTLACFRVLSESLITERGKL